MPIRTRLPFTSSTMMVMSVLIRTFSPGFLLRTNMIVLLLEGNFEALLGSSPSY
jgi:hypothetical protein